MELTNYLVLLSLLIGGKSSIFEAQRTIDFVSDKKLRL